MRQRGEAAAAANSEKVKRALINARNTIRQKFRQLHNNRANFAYWTNEEYKPITQPLKSLLDEKEIKKETEEAFQKEIKKQEPDMGMPSSSRKFKIPYRRSALKRRVIVRDVSPTSGSEAGNSEFFSQEEEDDNDDDEQVEGAVGGKDVSLMDVSGIAAHQPSDDEDGEKRDDYLADISTTAMEKPVRTPRRRLVLEKSNSKAQIIREIHQKDSPHLDTIYGFHTINNDLYLGNDLVKVVGKGRRLKYAVGEREYPMTRGLTALLLHNKPKNYSEKDLKHYKQMLVYTSAHKQKFKPNAPVKRFTGHEKYGIIKDLFPPGITRASKHVTVDEQVGEGLGKYGGCMQKKPQMNYKSVSKAGKFNYTYWDDPNELVDRLRILMASKSVGHTGHGNEIISIIEELREAKIIK